MKIDRLNPDNLVSGTLSSDITDTTTTSVIAAQGAGIRTYVDCVAITNSHASTGTVVQILDGSTIKLRLNAPAGSGFMQQLVSPLRGTANTAWSAKCETTGAAVQVFLSGRKESE